jgi:putative SOS response-associated peptidase YedK
VTTKPFFREAFKRTRCIILASGYYEWQDTPDGKQPHYFTRTGGQPLPRTHSICPIARA